MGPMISGRDGRTLGERVFDFLCSALSVAFASLLLLLAAWGVLAVLDQLAAMAL